MNSLSRKNLLRVIKLLVCLSAADAVKQRSWLDSGLSLLDGDLPSARYGHGFASAEDGKIYVFGGQGEEGDVKKPPWGLSDVHPFTPLRLEEKIMLR